MNKMYIWDYRIVNNIPGNVIAEFLDIDPEYYFDCENGKEELEIQDLEKLADLYGINISDFYNPETKNSILRFIFNSNMRTVITVSDLKEIAKFRRIIKAYERIETLLNE